MLKHSLGAACHGLAKYLRCRTEHRLGDTSLNKQLVISSSKACTLEFDLSHKQAAGLPTGIWREVCSGAVNPVSLMLWDGDFCSYIPAFLANTRHSASHRQEPAPKAQGPDAGPAGAGQPQQSCERFSVPSAPLQSVLMGEFIMLQGVQDPSPQNVQNWHVDD